MLVDELTETTIPHYEVFCARYMSIFKEWAINDFTVDVFQGNISFHNNWTPELWAGSTMAMKDSAIHMAELASRAAIILSCKNITTEIIKAPESLNKKRRKNGKQEIFDYHILNVTMPGEKQGYKENGESLSHNRVHLCRGHFKEYTQEHPLFGRHTGLYWWQPHVRGQNKDGIVMKEYNIRA